MVWPKSNCCSAHSCWDSLSIFSRLSQTPNNHTTSTSVLGHICILTPLMSQCAFTLRLLPLSTSPGGSCGAYCEGCRRRHSSSGCHYGAVTNTSLSPATLPCCRSPPAGLLDLRSRVPRCLLDRQHSPSPPSHTDTASCLEAKLCLVKDLRLSPSPLSAVWSEPAWFPSWGWVNSFLIVGTDDQMASLEVPTMPDRQI